MISVNLNDTPILNICSVYYQSIIIGISKSEAVNLLQNADLSKKVEHHMVQFLFITYKRMGVEIIAFGDIEIEKHKFHHYKKSYFFKECRY